jgi:hypothetical protein
MNDPPDPLSSPSPAIDLQALALTDAEAHALLGGLRARFAPSGVPVGFLGLSARRARQLALLAATAALLEVALLVALPAVRARQPLELALGAALLEGRPLTPRDVYLLHLWGEP